MFQSGMVGVVLRRFAVGAAGVLFIHAVPAGAQTPAGAPQGAQVQPAQKQEADDAPAPAAPGQTGRKLLDEANKAILMQNFLEAVRLGKRALLVDPKLVDAHKAIGVAYARLGRLCDARTHYKAYLDSNPDKAVAARIRVILDGEEFKNCP